MSKPTKAWCVFDGEFLLVWTVRCLRREAILSFTFEKSERWKELKNQGYTCRKVEIREQSDECHGTGTGSTEFWTRTPPTEEGFYPIIFSDTPVDDADFKTVVFVKELPSGVRWASGYGVFLQDITKFNVWWGPRISFPPPPESED